MSFNSIVYNNLSRLNLKSKIKIQSYRTPTTLSVNGNAKISTSQFKVGTSSLSLDGTNSYLNMSDNTNLTFNADFTIEFWVRPNSIVTSQVFAYLPNVDISIQTEGSNFIMWSGSVKTFGSIAINNWYHLAIVRSGSTVTGFYNGNIAFTFTSSITFDYNGKDFGRRSSAGYYFNGYLDEIRFSKIARYTTNFSTPTSAFINDPDTVLLIHAEGGNNSTSITDDNG